MTRDEILEKWKGMTDRERNVWVAEAVLKWQEGDDFVLLMGGVNRFGHFFSPSTNIVDAWYVLEALKPKWTLRITSRLKTTEVEFWWEYYASTVIGKSAPEAICKAALLAVIQS